MRVYFSAAFSFFYPEGKKKWSKNAWKQNVRFKEKEIPRADLPYSF